MKICLVCQGEINEDGWSQYAYDTNDGHDYIHHGCKPSTPTEPTPTAPGDTHRGDTHRGDTHRGDTHRGDTHKPPSEFLTLPDAAALLGVSPQTLRRRIKAGTLPAFRLAGGQTILVQRAALLQLLHRL